MRWRRRMPRRRTSMAITPIITIERDGTRRSRIDGSVLGRGGGSGLLTARENAHGCRTASAAAARQPEFQNASLKTCGKLSKHLKAANMRCLWRETLLI